MMQLLFVDDEPRVLDGLQRMLHSRRRIWNMTFALGGKEAIEQIDARPFDLIVSDLRMPPPDGLSVLAYARDHQPRAVRLALSGQTDVGMLTATVVLVHQLIAKPCDPATLMGIIERIESLQQLLGSPELRQVVGHLGKLPVLPVTYHRFTTALDDPDIPISEIVHIVEQDVALSARCLQLANSAYFGPRKQVDGLQHAVSFLGTAILRTLVLSSAVFSSFRPSPRLSYRALEGIERHSLAVASVARHLLPEPHLAQQAFLAGMLHDVGRLVLASSAPQDLATLPFVEQETGEGGDPDPTDPVVTITHAEIGAYLLGVWGLPPTIVEAVAHHHHPERIAAHEFDVLGAVYMAEGLLRERQAHDTSRRTAAQDRMLGYLSTLSTGPAPAELLADLRDRAATSLE